MSQSHVPYRLAIPHHYLENLAAGLSPTGARAYMVVHLPYKLLLTSTSQLCFFIQNTFKRVSLWSNPIGLEPTSSRLLRVCYPLTPGF